jgi:ankyrin repeat protein
MSGMNNGHDDRHRCAFMLVLAVLVLVPALTAFTEDVESWTLFSAVGADRIDVAEELLKKGADVNLRNSWGGTVLHVISVAMDNPVEAGADWGRLLVKYGVDLNARDDDGYTALCLAAESDRQNALLAYLVSAGADINLGNDEGVAPLSIASQHECRKNVAVLKAKGARLYSYQFPVDNSAAPCKAVWSKDQKALAAIPIEEFGRMVARTSLGVPANALHLAAEQGDLKVLRTLCGRKADWNVGDRYGRSPLQLAVLAGRSEAAALLLDNGADPNRADSRSSTAFSWACAVQPDIARLFLSKGLVPNGDGAVKGAICSGRLELVRALGTAATRNPKAAHFAAALGQVEIAQYLGASPELLEEARVKRSAYERYRGDASRPMEAAAESGGISGQRGTFPYVLESWSPWMKNEKVNLADYPVGIYVPKDYDGNKPFGLFVSMTNAKSSSRYPRDFEKTLDRHHVIWAGFDPYNGLDGANTAFCLAIVHNLLGHFSIDRSRIYIGGFSLGGQLTESMVRTEPGVFKGMVYININYGTGISIDLDSSRWYDAASLYHSRQNIPMVFVEGDYDYNRLAAYESYDTLLSAGYRNIHFVQEPMIGHRLISAASFEQAVSLLENSGGK